LMPSLIATLIQIGQYTVYRVIIKQSGTIIVQIETYQFNHSFQRLNHLYTCEKRSGATSQLMSL
jgi:hypothetical protein